MLTRIWVRGLIGGGAIIAFQNDAVNGRTPHIRWVIRADLYRTGRPAIARSYAEVQLPLNWCLVPV